MDELVRKLSAQQFMKELPGHATFVTRRRQGEREANSRCRGAVAKDCDPQENREQRTKKTIFWHADSSDDSAAQSTFRP